MNDLQVSQPKELVKKSYSYEPSQELRRFVEALLSEEVKGNKVKAESISHVARQRFYWNYKKHPEFREWFAEQCDLFLGNYEPVAGYALVGAMLKNDVQAIRTYYELRGKLKHIVKNEGPIVEVKIPPAINFISVKVENDRAIEHRDSGTLPRSIEAESSV